MRLTGTQLRRIVLEEVARTRRRGRLSESLSARSGVRSAAIAFADAIVDEMSADGVIHDDASSDARAYAVARLGEFVSELAAQLGSEFGDMGQGDPDGGFEFEGQWIRDPYRDEADDRNVDPREYYGDAFTNWQKKRKGGR